MRISKLFLATLLVLNIVPISVQARQARGPISDEAVNVLTKYEEVYNKVQIGKFQWYDATLYNMTNVDKADKLLNYAKTLIDKGNYKKAGLLLKKADEFCFLNPNDPNTLELRKMPGKGQFLKNPDLSKIRPTTIADYADKVQTQGVSKNDLTIAAFGYDTEGNYILIMLLNNYHGTGDFVNPAVVTINYSGWPASKTIFIKGKPAITEQTDNSITISCSDKDGQSSVFKIQKDKDKNTIAQLDLKLAGNISISFNHFSLAGETYWDGYNVPGGAIAWPTGGKVGGTEEVGYGNGTMTVGDKTITFKYLTTDIENAGTGRDAIPRAVNDPKHFSYSPYFIKFGNEKWYAFGSDQVKGIVSILQNYRDGMLFYKGVTYIPTSVEILPIVGGKSQHIRVKTAKGDFNFWFESKGYNPMFDEFAGPITGTCPDGAQITNGNMWLEHVLRGAPDRVINEDAAKLVELKP